MNDQRIQQALPAILVTIFSILFAIYAGSVIGSGQTRNLMLIAAGAGFVALGLVFRSNIWLLIPCFWSTTGILPFLALPFSVRDYAALIAFTWFLIFFAVRIIRTKASFNLLDFILFLNLCSLLFAFIRNPVGTLAVNSELIGGRPYFDVAIAFAAYFVLIHSKLSEKLSSRLPYIILIPLALVSIVGLAIHFLPGVGYLIAPFYSGFQQSEESMVVAADEVSRLTFLVTFGTPLFIFLISKYPLRSLVNPFNFFRFTFLIIALSFVLLSGFRNALFSCMLAGLIIPFYKKRRQDILFLITGSVVAFGLIITLQGRVINLPLTFQRTLSFLPGKWADNAKADALGSTEWRLYMWQAMLSDDKYINNKIFGDGFGFSQRLFNTSIAAQDMKQAHSSQEHFLITGQVHSGPLSAIRYVGIVGLALYLWLTIALSLRAHRLIMESRGTPFALVCSFIALPLVLHPFIFVFIFGGFDSDFAATIFSIGLIKLLESSLKRYKAGKKSPPPTNSEPKVKLPKLPQLPQLIDRRPPLLQR